MSESDKSSASAEKGKKKSSDIGGETLLLFSVSLSLTVLNVEFYLYPGVHSQCTQPNHQEISSPTNTLSDDALAAGKIPTLTLAAVSTTLSNAYPIISLTTLAQSGISAIGLSDEDNPAG